MSEERAARAEEVQRVTDTLYFWQAFEPAVRVELSSCAVLTQEGWVFIDPIPLGIDALHELLEISQPASIVLTNGNHARSSTELGQRFSIPILAHAAAEADLGIKIDSFLREGEMVAGGLQVIELAGAGPGEIALVSSSGLHLGDALINLDPQGLTFLPDKYCSDPKKLRENLRKLLNVECTLMTFAHGLPLLNRPRERLVQLLA
jgi:hypothetical protein